MFSAADLDPLDDPRAFALVNFYDSSVGPKTWRAFIRAARKAGGARFRAYLLEDRRGYVHAVVATRPDADLRRGDVLRVRVIACCVATGVFLHEALIALAERRAREIGCVGVAIEVEQDRRCGGAETLTARALNSGFERAGQAYFRAI
jgi:hypothetical protein